MSAAGLHLRVRISRVENTERKERAVLCLLTRVGGCRCVIDDDGGTYPDSTCGKGMCASEPPPPPTPGVPCLNNCNCHDYDLKELARDPQRGMTHVAKDNDGLHCYKFSLCGALPPNELPRGCQDSQGDGIAAVRYDCRVSGRSHCDTVGSCSRQTTGLMGGYVGLPQAEDLCEVLGTASKMFTSISTPTTSHPGQDLEIIYGRNEVCC